MKIVWLSANRLGYELLKEALAMPIPITALVTLGEEAKTVMYDGMEINKWHELGLPVHEINIINEEEGLLRSLAPDLIIMCGWRQIVGKEILALPTQGFVGFHPTLLPRGRGPAPLINSILQGFTESGLTMFYVTEGLDNGDLIGQEKFVINDNDHVADVYEKVIIAGRKLIRQYLPLLIAGKAPRTPQDESKSFVFPKRTLKDNEINLEKESPEEIFRKIKALSHPYKGAYLRLGGKKLIIWRAELKEETQKKEEPPKKIDASNKE